MKRLSPGDAVATELKPGADGRARLIRLFHQPNAGSGDPAYSDRAGSPVGRVPSRGGRVPLQLRGAISELASV